MRAFDLPRKKDHKKNEGRRRIPDTKITRITRKEEMWKWVEQLF